MTRLSPGDKITCHLRNGNIVSPYSQYDDSKDFEIVALDNRGYFLYVPDYYNLSQTTKVTKSNLSALSIDKRFLDSQIIYIAESMVCEVKAKIDGMICKECREFYQFSAPNQPDEKTFICWPCTNYPFYR